MMDERLNTLDRTHLFVRKNLGIDPFKAVTALRAIRVQLAIDSKVAHRRNVQIAALAAANVLGRTPAFVPSIQIAVSPDIQVASRVPFLKENALFRDELVEYLNRIACFTTSQTYHGPAQQSTYDLRLVVGPSLGQSKSNQIQWA